MLHDGEDVDRDQGRELTEIRAGMGSGNSLCLCS